MFLNEFNLIAWFRFDHRKDVNPKTGKQQNDMFVRNDIVNKYNVKQLW